MKRLTDTQRLNWLMEFFTRPEEEWTGSGEKLFALHTEYDSYFGKTRRLCLDAAIRGINAQKEKQR